MEENSILTDNTKKELNFTRFKKFFLLEFTRQLIKNSAPSEIFKLQTIMEKEREAKIEGAREKVRELFKKKEKGKVNEEEKNLSTSAKEIEGGEFTKMRSIVHAPVGMFQSQNNPESNPFGESLDSSFNKPVRNISRNNYFKNQSKKIGLSIPESKFPPHLQYIQPVPMNKEIELGKINPLINDQMVKIIECYGPGENIVVQGNMGIKRTGIILDKEDINNIIERFSKETKIPAQEGIFKVVVGKLIFMAIISNVISSKFIIKKMIPERQSTQPAFIR
jgi:hypothetical protein